MKQLLKNKLSAIILLGFLLALSSAFWTHDTAYGKDTQRHLEFGWPVTYVVQNQESLDPPYPWETSFGALQEHPSDVLWGGLLINTLLFSIVVAILVSLLYYAFPNNRKWLSTFKFKTIILIPVIVIILILLMIVVDSAKVSIETERAPLHGLPQTSVPIPQPTK